jgi:adenine-specific DNA-methyltransferase
MDLRSSGRTESCVFPVEFDGRTFSPGGGRSWKTNREGIEALRVEKRLFAPKDTLRYVLYLDDYPVSELSNSWMDTQGATDPVYVVQTATKVVERCMLMCTDPGDLVLDPTCGSGTAAYVAERFGRRWIVMDTSAVALSLARERLLTATFPYFRLVDDRRGVDAGFRYQTVAHLTLGSIARDEEAEELALRDQPEVDGSKVRVSGPFTFEALSRYAINPVQDGVPPDPGDLNAAADHVEALLDALKVRGVPVKGGHDLHITRIIRLSTTSPLHAEGATDDGRTFAVSVGPRYGPITMLQVDDALDDAHGYDLVVFVGFTATAEVQSHLSKGKVGRYNVVLLEANADLLVADLLKNTSASQTFRLFAAPDVAVARHKETLVLKLRGVDVYDASSGRAVSRGHEDIAAWFLDHDYDGQVFHVCQAFFPKSESWDDLAKALKGAINEEILARLRGFESSPFQPGEHGRAAVRVIDDNGQTSEAVIDLGD